MLSLTEESKRFVKAYHNTTGKFPDPKTQFACFLEEVRELTDANSASYVDIENEVKEIADVIFTAMVYGYLQGYNIDRALQKICDSNFTKFNGAEFRSDGKLKKGPNYVPPSMEDCVGYEADYFSI